MIASSKVEPQPNLSQTHPQILGFEVISNLETKSDFFKS